MSDIPEIYTVKADDFEMDYTKFGSGKRAFVIIPGLSLESVLLSRAGIEALYSGFKKDFTVYVFDRRKNPPESYTVREMARETAIAMKEVGIRDADIFGASQGGMMAQCIAVDYPELVHKLVLGSTMAKENQTSESVMKTWIEHARKGDIYSLNSAMFEKIYSKEYLEKYALAFERLKKNGSAEICERFVAKTMACNGFSIYDELEKIKCPVLVIGSVCDNVLTGEASVEIAEKLGCELYMYDGYSHAVYDEAPDYTNRVYEFLMKTN